MITYGERIVMASINSGCICAQHLVVWLQQQFSQQNSAKPARGFTGNDATLSLSPKNLKFNLPSFS
jgi:hypothetical protein